MVYEGSKKRLIITTIWRWVWVGLMGLGTGITVILCGWSSRIQRSILFLQSVSRQGLLKTWTEHFSFYENTYRVVQILEAGSVDHVISSSYELHIKILKDQTFFSLIEVGFSAPTQAFYDKLQILNFWGTYFRIEHNIEFTTFSRRALQILKWSRPSILTCVIKYFHVNVPEHIWFWGRYEGF